MPLIFKKPLWVQWGLAYSLTLPRGPGCIWEALLTWGCRSKKEGRELNTGGLFLQASQGTGLFSLMMENLCTCFPLQLQIICLNKADLLPSHFCSHQKGRRSEASLRRLYTDAPCLAMRRSSCAARHSCRVATTRFTETLWGGARGWNVATDGDRKFRKDRQRRAGGVMLYIKELLDYAVPQYQTGDMPAESFWVRIQGRKNLGAVVIGVCYRLQALRRQTRSLPLGALVLAGDFSYLVVCWKSSMASGRQSRRFLRVRWWHFPNANARGGQSWPSA